MPLAFPLLGIGAIAEALFELGLAIVATYLLIQIFKSIEGPLGKIPLVGGALAGAARTVAQAITGALGYLERGVDSAIGTMFHLLAKQFDWLWRQFKAHFLLIGLLSTLVADLTHAYDYLRHHANDVTKTFHGIEKGVRSLTKEFHGIEQRVRTLEKDWSKGIGHDLRLEVRALDRELTNVEHKVIPSIRGIAQTAENDVTALQKWIAANVPAIGTEVFAGAVAVALAALGLGGLRCSTLTNLLKGRGCGLWSGLESLLGLFIDTLLLENICTILPWLEDAFGLIEAPLISLLTEIPLGNCEVLPSRWATFSEATLSVPPAQTLGRLAA